MHKLKKATSTLRNYLGRDTHGLKLLAEVENIANDLRKKSATEIDRAEVALETKVAAQNDVRLAENESQELKRALIQEKSLRQQRERDVQALECTVVSLQKQLAPPGDQHLPESGVKKNNRPEARQIKSVLKTLRRQMRFAPKPTRLVQPNNVATAPFERYLVYELKSIATNLSGDNLMTLGRFVAITALFNFPCIIESQDTIKGEELLAESGTKNFFQWIQSSIELENFNFGGHAMARDKFGKSVSETVTHELARTVGGKLAPPLSEGISDK